MTMIKTRHLILALLFLCIGSLSSFAQRVTVNLQSVKMESVLETITKQTGYTFNYSRQRVPLDKVVSLDVNDVEIKTALDKLFAGSNIKYAIDGQRVSLTTVEQPSSAASVSNITGKVVDSDGLAVIGATIMVKGTTKGTTSSADGTFRLASVKSSDLLSISYIGYADQEVAVVGKSNVNIVLVEDADIIDEVIVVGYGTQKKANLTGAVDQIGSEIMESRPITSTSSALQGAIPNLQVTNSSGEPGSSATLNIRGTTSINGGSPLILVDGVEMDLDLVNPNDIASVTVLKDAASAAIYGVRAAYGVVLVTTKSAGDSEKIVVNYSGNVSISKPTVMIDIVDDSSVHAEFINEALTNAGYTQLFLTETVEKMKLYEADPVNNPEYEIVDGAYRYYGSSNWADEMIKDYSVTYRHNLSIQGGNQKTKFYASAGYLNQGGLIEYANDSYEQLNTRLNVKNQTTDWMQLSLTMLYNYSTSNSPYTYGTKYDVFHQLSATAPSSDINPWSKDPDYPEYDQYDGMYWENSTVYELMEGGRDITREHDVWSTAAADFNIMDGWKARVDFSYNLNYDNNSSQKKKLEFITSQFLVSEGNSVNNDYTWTNANKNYYSFNAYTEYEKTLNDKHYLKGMVGYNQELTRYYYTTASRQDMLSQTLPSLSLGTGTQTVTESGYEWALRGGFFRVNYAYDDRYLFEVNGRYDGTSRFPSDNRFVFLPSFSGAWRVSEEDFMSGTRNWLDNLKLRASYGILGNQLLTSSDWSGNTKYYPYIPFMSSGTASNYLFNSTENSLYISPAGLVSADLTWEKAKTVNFGIDFTMLRNRLDTSFDYYERTTSDMLISVTYPELLGTTAPAANSAELCTKGWEFSIDWKDKIGKDFSYGVGFVLSDSQAVITKYDNPTGSLSDYYVGYEIGEIWGYVTEGYFTSAEDVASHADQSAISSGVWAAGDVKYADLNGDGEISVGDNTLDDHGDLQKIGNTTPRYQYGISLNLEYKNVYLSAFFQGVGQCDYWPTSDNFWPAYTEWYGTQEWWLDNVWTEDNPDAYFPRTLARDHKNQETQTKYLQDMSYLRMKNLTIGWNIPQEWTRKIQIEKATVYFSGENLFEFCDVMGPFDPESVMSSTGSRYPFQRSYSAGINLTF